MNLTPEQLRQQVMQALDDLPFDRQRSVLEAARNAEGVAGKDLLRFAGTIDVEDLRQMATVIAADCERIDQGEW